MCVCWFAAVRCGAMASGSGGRVPSLSLHRGVRCVPEAGMRVEDVLVGVRELIGFEKIYLASRMNKAVVVFVTDETLIEEGIRVSESQRG